MTKMVVPVSSVRKAVGVSTQGVRGKVMKLGKTVDGKIVIGSVATAAWL